MALVLAALAVGVRPARPGRRIGWAAAAGVVEVVGVLAFAFGARESTAVAAVMASHFAVLIALGAYVFMGERLARRQVVAIGVTALGVALVASQAA